MANPHRGEVSLADGDRILKLSFSVNALCELEDHLDEPVAVTAERLKSPETVRMKTVRALVWASLLDHQPETTPAEAGQIASRVGIAVAMEKIGEAFAQAFPAPGSSPNPPKAPGAKAAAAE